MTDVDERQENLGRGGRVVYSQGPIIRILEAISVVSGLCSVVALIVALILLVSFTNRIKEGRRFAVAVTCAVESATSQAGYDVIVNGAAAPDSAFTRFLEAHGYPLRAARVVAAKRAGAAYVRSLSTEVGKRVGERAASLVEPDGSLNCDALERLSKVKPNPRLP